MANNEWSTPPKYSESAREVMGSIDLDPASNHEAQLNVNALVYFTIDNSGLDKQWFGNVWLNPPYGRGQCEPFISKLVDEYRNGNVKQAIVLTNSAYDVAWWKRTGINEICSAVCLPDHRINFIDPETNKPADSNNKNQTFFYIGDNTSTFCEVFDQYGLCLIPH